MFKERGKINTITKCGIFSALICILSPFVIPFGPIPISPALFAVMFTGVVLPYKMAVVSVAVYILLGALGVPVFSGFQGGINCLAGPTGGFIWSYPLVALVFSFASKRQFPLKLLLSALGILLCYTVGTLQYMLVSDSESILSALAVSVIPFVFFDVVKIICAHLMGKKVKNILTKQNLL